MAINSFLQKNKRLPFSSETEGAAFRGTTLVDRLSRASERTVRFALCNGSARPFLEGKLGNEFGDCARRFAPANGSLCAPQIRLLLSVKAHIQVLL